VFGLDDAALHSIALAVAKYLVKQGIELLKGDPEQRAFKFALADALSDFRRSHPDLVASLFDSGFLAGAGAPVVAKAMLRDGPPAAELATAYASQFYGGAEGHPERVEEMTPPAAEFLLRLDLAMRRQPLFQAHFDSLALDRSVVYLDLLVELSRAAWAEMRRQFILQSLGAWIRATELYVAIGETRVSGSPLAAGEIADARAVPNQVYLNLKGENYSAKDRLAAEFRKLVLDQYAQLEDDLAQNRDPASSLAALTAGGQAMVRLLMDSPPV
jgi:hypothetical protein